jgi:hypothetical protein
MTKTMDDLSVWSARFEAGQLHSLGIRQPKMEQGERFAVKIVSVGAHQQDLSIDMDGWKDQPGGGWRGWTYGPLGALFVTSQRARRVVRRARAPTSGAASVTTIRYIRDVHE